MFKIIDQNNELVAYLHKNLILLPEEFEVAGVILGQCVFGANGGLKGKYFHKTLYSVEGEKIGEQTDQPYYHQLDNSGVLQKTWQLLQKIKNHNSPWITPKESWAPANLSEFLCQ